MKTKTKEQTTKKWYSDGFGLHVLDAIAKRYGPGWEDGLFHCGGISTGTWVLAGQVGRKIAAILDLYESKSDFLEEN